MKRYTLYPIQNKEAFAMYKKAVAAFWTAEEIDMTPDKKQLTKMSDDEKYFVFMILAFFAGSDGIVLENLCERFMRDIDQPEVRAFYSFQMAMEAIHSETYSLLIDTYVQDPDQKMKLFDAINEFDSINAKAAWAVKWIEAEQEPFLKRLVAFAVVEGVFFSGAFCAIYWLKKRGLLPGLALSNEFISRDEALHTEFAVLMYNQSEEKLDEATVRSIVSEAVGIEKRFITEALPCRLIGMNADLMKEYIEFVADRLLVSLNCSKIWNAKNPFSFMDMISMEGKTNFFEKRVSEYSKPMSAKAFSMTAEF